MKDLRPLYREIIPSSTGARDSVDFSIIREMREQDQDGFQDLVEKLVTEFIENTPLEILEIRRGLISSDPNFKSRVYALKKSCANLGAKKMVRLLHLIEEGNPSFNSTLQLIEGLEDEFFHVYSDLLPYSTWYSLIKSEGWG